MVMYDNEFKTKENKILTKDKIETQHIYLLSTLNFAPLFHHQVSYWQLSYLIKLTGNENYHLMQIFLPTYLTLRQNQL